MLIIRLTGNAFRLHMATGKKLFLLNSGGGWCGSKSLHTNHLYRDEFLGVFSSTVLTPKGDVTAIEFSKGDEAILFLTASYHDSFGRY